MRVTVVGGGLAGIAAALECAQAGVSVTLYEARSRLGGETFSFERNGLWLDNGQHVALRCCSAYLAFLRRIGSDHLLEMQETLRVPVLREGRPAALLARRRLPAPLHLAPTLATYGPLSVRERVRAIRAARALHTLDPGDADLDRQTFGAWLAAHGQSPAAIAALWDLIALPTLNLPAADASLLAAVKVFRTGVLDSASGGDIGLPSVCFRELHELPARRALAQAGVRVEDSTRVSALSDSLELTVDGDRVDADAVILAVPHEAAAELAPRRAGLRDLRGLGESPIVNLHVHYDRTVLDEPLAAALGSPVQWLFDRTAASGAPTGQLIAVSLSHAVEEIGRPVGELRARYLRALERLLPAARGAGVLDFAVTHSPRATFAATPGTHRLRPGTHTALPGLYLAGAWTDTGWPATMEGAVRSGLQAAHATLGRLGASPPRSTTATATSAPPR